MRGPFEIQLSTSSRDVCWRKTHASPWERERERKRNSLLLSSKNGIEWYKSSGEQSSQKTSHKSKALIWELFCIHEILPAYWNKSLCRWRDERFSNWASPPHGANTLWPNIALLDISDRVSGYNFLCHSGILEPILWLSPKCTIYLICFNSNCSTSNGQVRGSASDQETYPNSCNKMVIFIESRALQPERACPHHHICQFRFNLCFCSRYCHHSEGLLSPENSSTCSHVINPNYTGASLFKHLHSQVFFFLLLLSFLEFLYLTVGVQWIFRCLDMDGSEFSESF